VEQYQAGLRPTDSACGLAARPGRVAQGHGQVARGHGATRADDAAHAPWAVTVPRADAVARPWWPVGGASVVQLVGRALPG
jgi:hypothetical protein